MGIDEDLVESDLFLCTAEFESGARDFCLWKVDNDGQEIAVNPLELLVLDRALEFIEEEARTNQPRAMNQALCRLLVPSVRTARVGRHLVNEQWSEQAVQGQTLAEDVRSSFAVELSREQAEKWRVVQAGEQLPRGNLEETFWNALTELPKLPRQFDDLDLGKFGRAFYHHLVSAGEGRMAFDSWASVTNEVERIRSDSFRELGLGFDSTYMMRLYRKYMAVTIRWSSKLTAKIARAVIDNLRGDDAPLSRAEELMHELRYGAADCFGKINVGYLFGCGRLFECFFNDIFRSIARNGEQSDYARATGELLQFVYLHRNYVDLLKHAWREEKQQQRERYQDTYPGERESPSRLIDTHARSPAELAAISEEMLIVQEQILPELERTKPKQAEILRLYLENNGDTEFVAEALGFTERQVTRRLSDTIFQNAQAAARRLNLNQLLDD